MSPPDSHPREPVVSENTPLLATSSAELVVPLNESEILQDAPAVEVNGHTEDAPFQRNQIFLLSFARMIEPVAFFGIFAFVNEMIQKVGDVAKSEIGFYSGLIESAFGLTQMLFMISWGRASDHPSIGRKPVLIVSLAGLSILTCLFGFARSIPAMVTLRSCSGIFAGTIVTIRTMITENCTPSTQARAFSYFAFSGNLGIFLGPLIGGALANPVEQYESVFGSITLFKTFPYALSTLTSGFITAVACVICGLFVKETLKSKINGVQGEETVSERPLSSREVLKSPGVPYVLYLYSHVGLLGMAYTAVMPVFFYTPVKLGGYGFSPLMISGFLSLIGIAQAVWLLVFFPSLHKRYGTKKILRVCLTLWPIFFLGALVSNELLRHKYYVMFWIIAPFFQTAGSGVAMAFTCVQLALNDISPSSTSLGTLNGIALALTSAVRAVGPAIFTSIFAEGVRTQFINGHLVWLVLMTLGASGAVSLRWFPDKADPSIKKHHA